MTSFPNSGDRTCSLRYFYTRREIGYSKAKHFNPKLLELDGNITQVCDANIWKEEKI